MEKLLDLSASTLEKHDDDIDLAGKKVSFTSSFMLLPDSNLDIWLFMKLNYIIFGCDDDSSLISFVTGALICLYCMEPFYCQVQIPKSLIL